MNLGDASGSREVTEEVESNDLSYEERSSTDMNDASYYSESDDGLLEVIEVYV